MPRAKFCCNPLNFDKHRKKRGDFQVTDKWDPKFHVLEGLFVCKSCKPLMYLKKNEITITRPASELHSRKVDDDIPVDNLSNNVLNDSEKEDPSYQLPKIKKRGSSHS